MDRDQTFMSKALQEAAVAESHGEIPVGALVVREGKVIARAHNRNILDSDPSSHAEMVALRDAARKMGNHRLEGCELFVTMEPCAMCAGAIIHARLSRVVYGADDPKAGAVASVMQVVNHPKLNHQLEVKSGVLAQECGEIVRAFFKKRRAEKKDQQ